MKSNTPIIKGIFINTRKANCSIYESGRMIYECLMLSDKYELDYQEVDENSRSISDTYDFYAFNYHHTSMGWLDTRFVRKLPGLKLTFVLEVARNDPFVHCPSEDFDVYCVLDPTINIEDKRVYAFPRPLEVPVNATQYRELPVPVIGTFGFATPGKGFELVVDAVNREFDEAIVRINIPVSTHADDFCWHFHKQNYADYLSKLCKRTAKKGIQVMVTHDFMSKEKLIEWCSENTLNCFMYNRNQAGLSATTDQAISSGRPLAISTNDTFRHITSYIQPYPFRSLKESIAFSQPEVLQVQKEWSPRKFATKFEDVLRNLHCVNGNINKYTGQKILLPQKNRISNLLVKVDLALLKAKKKMGITQKISNGTSMGQECNTTIIDNHRMKILIVSHKEKQCGIHQYAINIFEALRKSTKYEFDYIECACQEELRKAIVRINPDAIIYNYYPTTMPWLSNIVTRQFTMPQLGIMHEVTQEEADKATAEKFDFYLCPDPTLIENSAIICKTKRLIPPYVNTKNIPDIVTIGSFGFGFGDKGFEHLIKTVQYEFDQANIILHLPFNDIVDKNGKQHALATAKRCKRLVTKPGIKLAINHDFISKTQLLDFLASNTLNAFFYEAEKLLGISSTIEHALAVQRPMAITKCGMFRHIFSTTPSICIEDSSLKEIINNGIAPLVSFNNEWSEASFIMDYDRILDKVFQMAK